MSFLDYPLFFIMSISIVLSLILTVVNKVLVDQERVKEIQEKVKAYNKKLMKATRENNQEEKTKLEKEKPNIMKLQSELMKMQMPVFASMLPFFVVFFLMRKLAVSMEWGAFVNLPSILHLPFLGLGDGTLTWLGWYILCSLPFTSLFRKVLGVR